MTFRHKSLLTLNGKNTVIEGYSVGYDYETHQGLTICTGQDNCVISVENNSETKVADIFYGDSLLTGLSPGSTMSFGSLRLTKNDLTFAFRDKKILDDECDNFEDCND